MQRGSHYKQVESLGQYISKKTVSNIYVQKNPNKTWLECAYRKFKIGKKMFKDFIYLFLERGEGKERERNINVWLPLMWPPLGTWPTTQLCALTGNRTDNPLVRRLALNHWATTARAENFSLIIFYIIFWENIFLLIKKFTLTKITTNNSIGFTFLYCFFRFGWG